MTGEEIIALASAKRAQQGLKLEFVDPIDGVFTCYPKDQEQKDKWLASAKVRGWQLVSK